MPRLSVIVCTYNREASLCDVLSDLLAQDFDDFETIVVDQTVAHAPATAEFFARHQGRLRHLRIAEPNLSAARNIGAEAARGDILVYVDDDLRLQPDFLGELAAFFRDESVCVMGPRVVPEPYEPSWEPDYPRLRGGTSPTDPRRVPYCIGACLAVRRSAARDIGGFDELMGRYHRNAAVDDIEFTRRLDRAGHHLWYVPALTVRHMSGVEGGCENRTGPDAFDMERHARGVAYMILKEEGALERLNLRALLRLVRLTAVRRDVLLSGPAAFARGVARVGPLATEVRSFVRADMASAASRLPERVDDSSPL
jgi:GT2 family glycosyltransferase